MDTEEKQCCICFKNDAGPLLLMPCCGTPSSSSLFCHACLKAICDMANNARPNFGQCPICRKAFEFKNGELSIGQYRGQCRMCCQTYELGPDHLCEKCVVGRDYALRYICDRCGKTQTIPHPMWKYQATPEEKGTASWACHQQCGDYTYWTIQPEDVASIPQTMVPASWTEAGHLAPSLERVRSFMTERL